MPSSIPPPGRRLLLVLSVIFPPGGYCYLCGDAAGGSTVPACRRCRGLLALQAPRCRVCRRYLTRPGPGGRQPVNRCRQCLVLPPPFLGVTAAGAYTGLLRWAVGRFKGARETWLVHVLAAILAEAVAADGIRVDVVVPVPGEPRRLRQRGYNPPALLAAQVARRLRLPLHQALTRWPGPPQARLTQRDRWLHTGGVYRLRVGAGLAGARVLLLDDVITTGATLTACTRLLLGAGAAFVWCGAVADTPRRM